MRAALLLCTGCLVADAPDGEWSSLTRACVPLGDEPTQLLRAEPYVHTFAVAGDTLVFDDVDGISQLALRDRDRRVIARTNTDEGVTEFATMGDDLVYYARTGDFITRDLVVDRGVDQDPRWLTVERFAKDDFTQILANPAGMYLRSDSDGVWRHWDRTSNRITRAPIHSMSTVTTDGVHLFYDDGQNLFENRRDILTLPVEGGEPTVVAEVDGFTVIVGIFESRLFVWHQDLPNNLDEITPSGPRSILDIPEIGVPARRAFGGGYFYFVPNADGPDTIFRVSLDDTAGGNGRETIAPIVGGAFGVIQADACNLYWQVIRSTGGIDLWGMRH